MLSHEELYRGLPKEQAAGWREEATQKWGKDAVERSEMRLLTMTREDLAALKEAFVENCGRLASMMDKDPADAEVQAAVGIHYGHIRQFWGTAGTPDPQLKAYQCLGEMYTQDDRYTMTDGKPNPAFAAFLSRAINRFVESR